MHTRQLARIDKDVIERVRTRLLEACNPHTIVLFGSAARNELKAGSDLDILVVLSLPPGVSARQKARELHTLFEGWLLPLDIVVLSPEEWARGLDLPGHIARIAAREGVRLYG